MGWTDEEKVVLRALCRDKSWISPKENVTNCHHCHPTDPSLHPHSTETQPPIKIISWEVSTVWHYRDGGKSLGMPSSTKGSRVERTVGEVWQDLIGA